ncbi:MAG: hypothetical protein DMG24_14280 [Acidobacteria bacterium]|nr:MAG: hypothetical protein DMG24_14280 [Acidobacteriota bacterium]
MWGQANIPIPEPRVRAFCQRWKIAELSLFGSVLRKDFGPDSDVDVLVMFSRGTKTPSCQPLEPTGTGLPGRGWRRPLFLSVCDSPKALAWGAGAQECR